MHKKFQHPVSSEISLTYITSKKRLTIVAALGVTIGIAIYIFLNSMMMGFSKFSDNMIFKSIADVRIYRDDEISTPLIPQEQNGHLNLLINPNIVPNDKTIVNPHGIMDLLRKQEGVTMVSAQVASPVFYHKGESEFSGNTIGVNIDEANRLYDIQSTMVAGDLHELNNTPNGVIIGVGVAEKLSVKVGDNISLTSPKNVPKVLRVVGLFKTANAAVDKSRSYMNIATAQQILLKGPEYVSDINVKITNHDLAPKYAAKFSVMTGYKAEDWQTANATFVSASKMRAVILGTISFTVLIVAAFGIYNILSMTISQKLNDIAILKAMGFKGRDVTRIFVQQALIIGAIGVIFGLILASLLIYRMSKVYLGGDIGYFPIQFEWTVYLRGAIIGILVTFFAGLIPARKAANVDPVSILRK